MSDYFAKAGDPKPQPLPSPVKAKTPRAKTPRAKTPRSGAWGDFIETVKFFGGAILVAAALWLVGTWLSDTTTCRGRAYEMFEQWERDGIAEVSNERDRYVEYDEAFGTLEEAGYCE